MRTEGQLEGECGRQTFMGNQKSGLVNSKEVLSPSSKAKSYSKAASVFSDDGVFRSIIDFLTLDEKKRCRLIDHFICDLFDQHLVQRRTVQEEDQLLDLFKITKISRVIIDFSPLDTKAYAILSSLPSSVTSLNFSITGSVPSDFSLPKDVISLTIHLEKAADGISILPEKLFANLKTLQFKTFHKQEWGNLSKAKNLTSLTLIGEVSDGLLSTLPQPENLAYLNLCSPTSIPLESFFHLEELHLLRISGPIPPNVRLLKCAFSSAHDLPTSLSPQIIFKLSSQLEDLHVTGNPVQLQHILSHLPSRLTSLNLKATRVNSTIKLDIEEFPPLLSSLTLHNVSVSSFTSCHSIRHISLIDANGRFHLDGLPTTCSSLSLILRSLPRDFLGFSMTIPDHVTSLTLKCLHLEDYSQWEDLASNIRFRRSTSDGYWPALTDGRSTAVVNFAPAWMTLDVDAPYPIPRPASPPASPPITVRRWVERPTSPSSPPEVPFQHEKSSLRNSGGIMSPGNIKKMITSKLTHPKTQTTGFKLKTPEVPKIMTNLDHLRAKHSKANYVLHLRDITWCVTSFLPLSMKKQCRLIDKFFCNVIDESLIQVRVVTTAADLKKKDALKFTKITDLVLAFPLNAKHLKHLSRVTPAVVSIKIRDQSGTIPTKFTLPESVTSLTLTRMEHILSKSDAWLRHVKIFRLNQRRGSSIGDLSALENVTSLTLNTNMLSRSALSQLPHPEKVTFLKVFVDQWVELEKMSNVKKTVPPNRISSMGKNSEPRRNSQVEYWW
eukprot:TRINITY_DN8339_c0_g1_i1.p1 TRINITY_DN8339_c0_g1~~TRINITY_DN8339_c0_g1_i1.p1  ORF type:complete len:778 (-),score=208.79 TRINITY_DN8339_c0_g1_i1:788-3121(-)